jgi:DNA-binding transcriptional ArsR family regulator
MPEKKKPQSKSAKKPKPIRRKSIKEVRKDRLKSFFDRRLIDAMRHPVREHILAVLNERHASTVEIGDEIGLDVTAFYSHVQTLEKMGLIEEVDAQPARGATEHFLGAKVSAFFDDEAWAAVPVSVRANFDGNLMQSLLDDVTASFETGAFYVRPDRHFTWMPVMLDIKGWREVVALLAETLERLRAICRRSAKRLQKTGEPGIPATMAILAYERNPDFKRRASA